MLEPAGGQGLTPKSPHHPQSPTSVSAGTRLLVPPRHLPAPSLRDSCSIHTSEKIPQDLGWLAWAISHPISQSWTDSYVWGSEWGSRSTPGQGWVPGGQSSNHRGVVLDAQQRCPLNPGRTQRWQAHQGSFGFLCFYCCYGELLQMF